MIKMNSYKELSKAIKEAKSIAIASHVSPDGDNLGSSLGLYLGLKKIKKDVKVLKVDKIPEKYLFLPAVDQIEEAESNYKPDLFIALDCADEDRLHINKDLARSSKMLINLDHHISNTMYGDLNLIEKDSSSTGELVYKLMVELGIEIDDEIASCIYTAISSDTGSFKYSNTSGRTHKIVSELYKTGFNPGEINIKLYQNQTMEQTKLFSHAMSGLETYFQAKVGLIVVSQEMLKKTGAKMEDTEGLVEQVRDIKGIELAILLKEKEDCIKVSTRSKAYFNASDLCAYFNGGGHKRAAGCTIYKSMQDAKDEILEKVESLI